MCDRWELRRCKGLSTDPGKDHFEKQGIFLFFYTDETLPKIQKWWRLTYFQCFSRGWGKIGYMFEMKWTCVSPRDQHKCLLWPWPNPNRKSAILYFLLIFGDLHILSCNKTWPVAGSCTSMFHLESCRKSNVHGQIGTKLPAWTHLHVTVTLVAPPTGSRKGLESNVLLLAGWPNLRQTCWEFT